MAKQKAEPAKKPAKDSAKPVKGKAKATEKPKASAQESRPKAKEKSKPKAKEKSKTKAKAILKPIQAASKSPKAVPAKKPKIVRDSFTMPKIEYEVLDKLKKRAAALDRQVKKSELLRAGIAALDRMEADELLAALSVVPAIKTGRPVK